MEDNLKEKPSRTRKPLSMKTSSAQDAGAGYGKLPPQALDLEEAVLGALMLERNAVNAVIDLLRGESFYKESHQRIYGAIQRLFARSEPVDILTVTEELRKSAELELVGGAYYITQLTSRVASAANIEYHARIIMQKHIQRELIRISSDTIREAYEDTTDVLDLLNKAEQNIFQVSEGNIRRSYDDMTTLIGKALKRIEVAGAGKGLSGVPSGFTALDTVTAGWQNSDLVILAARPGMGKTAFVLSTARETAVRHKRPVAMFSLEMSSEQLVTRLIASETEIPAEKLKRGGLAEYEWHQLHQKITSLTDAPIFIDDTAALSVFELRAKCRRLKAQHDIQLVIVDYLQLMTTGSEGKGHGNREQEISTISRSLKGLAKELNIPIIALSQLSRAVETRTSGDKRPQLSDLRESGAIEQDADMVIFIYRPEYYHLTEDAEGRSTRGLAELHIAKHRNGSIATVPVRFIDKLAKFTDANVGDFIEEMEGDASRHPGVDDFQPNKITRGSKMNDPDEDVPF